MTTPPGSTQRSLLQNHPGTEVGVDGNLRGRGGDVRFTNAAGDIYSVQQDAVAVDLRLEGDARAIGKFEKRGFLFKGKVILDGLERQSPVHSSGFEIEEAEAAGEMGSQGALASASRAVDSNDGALTFRTRLRIQPRF